MSNSGIHGARLANSSNCLVDLWIVGFNNESGLQTTIHIRSVGSREFSKPLLSYMSNGITGITDLTCLTKSDGFTEYTFWLFKTLSCAAVVQT